MTENERPEAARPHVLVRILDRVVVALVMVLIGLAKMKSRDVSEDPQRALQADERWQRQIRTWQSILQWPATQRVGCFVGVAIGVAIGLGFLWYALRD